MLRSLSQRSTIIYRVAFGLGLISLVGACNRAERDLRSVDVRKLSEGKVLFEQNCAACHQLGGQGAQRVPPLDGSPWVSGSEQRLIRIVLHGLRGPIEIRGKIYNLEMPSFGTRFSDEQISDFLTYVRHQFGATNSPVTADTIRSVRQATQDRDRYWTVAELNDVL